LQINLEGIEIEELVKYIKDGEILNLVLKGNIELEL
jgi:hypothetical protein